MLAGTTANRDSFIVTTPSDQEIRMTRLFDAPRNLVFDAMTNPELMILDEATEGLAPLIRKEIWQVIRAVKDTGIATLVVDKNVGVLLDLTDRSMIMVKGRVVYDGPSAELKQQPELLQEHIGL